ETSLDVAIDVLTDARQEDAQDARGAQDAQDERDARDADAPCAPETLPFSGACVKKWEGCLPDGGQGGFSVSVDDAGNCPPGYARSQPSDIQCYRTACSGRTPICSETTSCLWTNMNGYLCCYA